MLLLSIHSRYVEKIVRGEKTVELRRHRPRLSVGERIAVYATAPRKALVGMVTVVDVQVAAPDELWPSVSQVSGISRQQYNDYFSGSRRAVGIFFAIEEILKHPVSLESLRDLWPGFQPPQSFRYLDAGEVARLESLCSHPRRSRGGRS